MNSKPLEDNTAKEQKADSRASFLLERLWKSYELADNRRRRSFYSLFVSTAMFALLLVTEPESFKLPLFGNEVSLFVAMSIGPAFILICSISYFYLCAHTLHACIYFLTNFWYFHNKWLRSLGLTFSQLHGNFKQRDVSSILNINLFLTGYSAIWDDPLPCIIRKVARLFVNALILLTLLIPATTYIGITYWLWKNYQPHLSALIGKTLIWFYIVMSSAFVLGPIYFYFRAKPARHRYKSMVQEGKEVENMSLWLKNQ